MNRSIVAFAVLVLVMAAAVATVATRSAERDPSRGLIGIPDDTGGLIIHHLLRRESLPFEAIWLKDRRTVLMVTHDLDEAIYLSDRVIVMSAHHGEILEDLAILLERPRVRRGQRYYEYRDRLTEVLRIALGGMEGRNDPRMPVAAV